jgi:hypothetical protein
VLNVKSLVLKVAKYKQISILTSLRNRYNRLSKECDLRNRPVCNILEAIMGQRKYNLLRPENETHIEPLKVL